MVALELVCVRHGTTALNTARIFAGQSNDPPLSDVGEAQAVRLAERLGAERFDYAVSSDLQRAAQTARAILGGHASRLVVDRDWREFDFGAWEGLTWDQIAARFPAEAAAFRQSISACAPPGGESFVMVGSRVAAGLARVKDALPAGGRALIVTHTGPLHALRQALVQPHGDDAFRAHFSPAGITRYLLAGASVEVLALDDIAHLPEDHV